MRLKNEPENIQCLHPHDQITWWIGAIAREAAQVEHTGNLILRAILQNCADELESHYKNDRDRMWKPLVKAIHTELSKPEVRVVAPHLASKIECWLTSIDMEERHRVIHDVIAASPDGYISFSSGQTFSDDRNREITRTHMNQVFTELQQAWQAGTELWTEAVRAWCEPK